MYPICHSLSHFGMWAHNLWGHCVQIKYNNTCAWNNELEQQGWITSTNNCPVLVPLDLDVLAAVPEPLFSQLAVLAPDLSSLLHDLKLTPYSISVTFTHFHRWLFSFTMHFYHQSLATFTIHHSSPSLLHLQLILVFFCKSFPPHHPHSHVTSRQSDLLYRFSVCILDFLCWMFLI